LRPRVYLCEGYYAMNPQDMILTLLHEVGHLSKLNSEEIQNWYSGTKCEQYVTSQQYNNYIAANCGDGTLPTVKLYECKK
jgi:hypothetical protein